MRIGELFSGYGGLGMGVQAAIGGVVVWHSEIESAPSTILEHRYPGVPNHGDLTEIDWSQVEPVDILTGGFPCQDVSSAGKRAGLRPDTRSGLWAHMAHAIEQLRPALVVAENVRGLLSAQAHSEVEPCPFCLGDGSSNHMRALGTVLADLADIGYDARWCGLRAADVGAPHGRFRIFLTAEHAPSQGLQGASSRRIQPSLPCAGCGRPVVDAHGPGLEGRDASGCGPYERPTGPTGLGSTANAESDRRHEGRPESARVEWGPDASECGATSPHTNGASCEACCGRPGSGDTRRLQPVVSRGTNWGTYGPAVSRWANTIGRPAPEPTEPGRNGKPRLSPRFVEWMMGLPAGWVTDVPISRNSQLKALGNGVVPQQAEAALRHMLTAQEVAA